MRLDVISAKKRSTRFSHDALVGVMFFQPRFDLGRLVGGLVVEHQMHVARLDDGPVDAAQKTEEFLGPPLVVCRQTTAGQWVAWQAFADDHAGLHFERCEQRGRAVALMGVGHRGGAALLERQSGLGSVKRLNLRLFVNAEHDGPVRRVEVKSHDIRDLLLEHRVAQHLETARQVRLQPCFRPDAQILPSMPPSGHH